jgi:hypothetical protein
MQYVSSSPLLKYPFTAVKGFEQEGKSTDFKEGGIYEMSKNFVNIECRMLNVE